MNKSNLKTGPPNLLWFSVVGALVLLAVLLYACAPAPTPRQSRLLFHQLRPNRHSRYP